MFIYYTHTHAHTHKITQIIVTLLYYDTNEYVNWILYLIIKLYYYIHLILGYHTPKHLLSQNPVTFSLNTCELSEVLTKNTCAADKHEEQRISPAQ